MPLTAKKQTALIWILTVIITLTSVVYQRLTGPTYPIRGSVEIDGETVSYKLLTSHYSSSDAVVTIEAENEFLTGELTGELKWRRLKSNDDWRVDSLSREEGELQVVIPRQPPAGKIAYRVTLIDGDDQRYDLSKEPVVIRFKSDVPIYILIPHVLMMFISMLLGTRTGLEALYKRERAYRLALNPGTHRAEIRVRRILDRLAAGFRSDR
jgi:hypothetical protein